MKKNLFYFIAAIICLALAMLACSSVSSLTSLANSGSSSATDNATSVPINTGSSGDNGSSNSGSASGGNQNVVYQDDFSNDNSGWGTGSDANKVVQYTNDTLEFQVLKAEDMVYSGPNETDYKDIHIEVTATPNNTDKNSYFGILCDQQVTSDAFYYGAITPAGQYAIAKAAVAEDDVFLTGGNNWKTSKLIPVNASSYTIGFDCGSDGTLTLYVNGKQIDSVTDTTYTDGYIGLFAASDKKANSADVNFSNYVATSLK
jgi:hypothetical protein